MLVWQVGAAQCAPCFVYLLLCLPTEHSAWTLWRGTSVLAQCCLALGNVVSCRATPNQSGRSPTTCARSIVLVW